MAPTPETQMLPNDATTTWDYVLVGGGLQNLLLLLALRTWRPEASVALLEASDRVGGKHTWCFHRGDVPEGAHALMSPLLSCTWPGYDVAFPHLERHVASPYAAMESERVAQVVHEVLRAAPHCRLRLGARATEVMPDRVQLTSGEVLNGRVVIAARGPERSLEQRVPSAFQKFLGLELELARPAPRSVPMLMDATVEQLDGFRFVYVLPFSPTRVLLEDTYYSETAELDVSELRRRVLSYATSRGYHVSAIASEELGVLPLPLRSNAEPRLTAPLEAGYSGGWFHPTTGYSLPSALRLAMFVAQHEPDALYGSALERLARAERRQRRFAVLLNRMLFGAFAPEDRRNVLERFYRLPSATIERFYALRTTPLDRARILCGRPPRGLSIPRALTAGAHPL